MTNQNFSFPFFADRLKLVLQNPKGCWSTIAGEQRQPKELVMKLALPAAIIAAVCNMIGMVVFGISLGPMGTIRPGFGYALSVALQSIVFGVVGPFVYAFVAQKVSSFCDGSSDFSRAYSWGLHATLVGVVGGVAMLYPPIGTIVGFFCGFYSLYVAYVGIGEMLNVPEAKRIPFFVGVLIGCVVVGATLTMVLGILMVGSLAGNGALPPIQ
jgi:hypothetical protein